MSSKAMSQAQLLAPLQQFLHCQTPQAWLDHASQASQLPALLIDHCNCELKAAQTAVWLVRKYAITEELGPVLLRWMKPYEDFVYRRIPLGPTSAKNDLPSGIKPADDSLFSNQLLSKMILLVKEELHHFEQVLAIMNERNIAYQNISAGRYAKGLMKCVRTYEPAALIDKLIIGAYIEARSCERFAKLSPYLDPELHKFYTSLLRSEARHYQDYLSLAKLVAEDAGTAGQIDERIKQIGEKEAELICQPDPEFRFHSGVPES